MAPVFATAGRAGRFVAFGRVARRCMVARAVVVLGLRSAGLGGRPSGFFGREASGLGGLFLGTTGGLFLGLLIIFGAAFFVLGLLDLDAVVASAGLLERGHARFV